MSSVTYALTALAGRAPRGMAAGEAIRANRGTVAVVRAATTTSWPATGPIGPLRYVVLYDATVTSPVTDPLISSCDYGSSISLACGETFTVDFQSNTLFTIA